LYAVDPVFAGLPASHTNFIIWRVEDFALVALPREQYGQFHKGDSYLIYSAFEKGQSTGVDAEVKQSRGFLQQFIHFWLGSQTSTDEAGVAAIKAVELDEYLDGSPVQQREVEGNESKRFLSYFKQGIRILQGGVASGLHHVSDDFQAVLYSVKGKRKPVIRHLSSVSWSLMNEGDVFVLDNRNYIFVWVGRSANNPERLHAAKLALSLKEQHGQSNINMVIVEDRNELALPDDELEVFDSLLSLSEKKLGKVEEDEEFEKAVYNEIKLYRCTDDDGRLKVIQVKDGPLFQSDLTSNDSYIVDNGANGIYVWVGKSASKQERSEAMRNGLGFAMKKGYPTATNVTRVIDGGEPAEFRSLFNQWKVAQETIGLGNTNAVGKVARIVHSDFDAATLHEHAHLAADCGMVDDGCGGKKIFRVVAQGQSPELVPVDAAHYGLFYAGDCYVVVYCYTVGGSERNIIYYWLGSTSGQDERATAALKAIDLDNEMNGRAVQVRVVQGKEPMHFLAMFKGKLVIFSGGHASSFEVQQGETDQLLTNNYLLQVRGNLAHNTKAIQVPLKASSLNSNDVFLLVTSGAVYMWCGKGSSGDEREMAKVIAAGRKQPDFFIICEGQEKEEFWQVLGGRDDYWSDKRTAEEYHSHEPRLFHCSNASGNLKVAEILDFSQNDLVEEDVMILDTHTSIFLWIGVNSVKDELLLAEKLTLEYLSSDPKGRDQDTPIYKVRQGCEPPTFTGFFGVWNPNEWESHMNFDKLKEQMLKENPGMTVALRAETNDSDVEYYPLRVLKERDAEKLPQGVDPTRKEFYLHDKEFEKVFKMSRQSYETLPSWKRQNLKKAAGLF